MYLSTQRVLIHQVLEELLWWQLGRNINRARFLSVDINFGSSCNMIISGEVISISEIHVKL